MNLAVFTGCLNGKPTEGKEFFGQHMYWISLTALDGRGGRPETFEVAVSETKKDLLIRAFGQHWQLIVQGPIHSCEGTDLSKPGPHRFVLAEVIEPFNVTNVKGADPFPASLNNGQSAANRHWRE